VAEIGAFLVFSVPVSKAFQLPPFRAAQATKILRALVSFLYFPLASARASTPSRKLKLTGSAQAIYYFGQLT
jgi:predicted lysophospholipase L1 biosynthesis ABC-type transport system permease subunit